MGNRAVITTQENFENNGVGVYLHWNDGRDSVEAFLKYCKMKGYRPPEQDDYGWARLCQVIGNFFGGSNSVGIGTGYGDVGDNGTYIIENWEIVDRKYFEDEDGNPYEEQSCYDPDEMLCVIDASMPAKDQFGEMFMKAPVIKTAEMKTGDTVAYVDWDGEVVHEKILGIGVDEMVNGRNVFGVPYTGKYMGSNSQPEKNINNYLFDDKEYRISQG